MTTEERLITAISDRESLDIIYHGGSQPGTVRKIAPISIKDGKVRAFCYASNAMKLFAVENISIVDGGEQVDIVAWQPRLQPSQHYTSIEELVEKRKQDLFNRGWHVESSVNHVSLHRIYKNGKPMKGSDVSLDFAEYTHDLIMDEEGIIHEENIRKKQRPWTVRAKNKDTRTYGSLDAASELFLEWAGILDTTALSEKG
jgi:hypothetical protein